MAEKLYNREFLEVVISTKIEREELLGEQTGGSGHKGYVEYRIDRIHEPNRIKIQDIEGWEINYDYTLIVTTEFTVYPHNSPYEYRKTGTIVLENSGKPIG